MADPSFIFVDHSTRQGGQWRTWLRCDLAALETVRRAARNMDVYCTLQRFAKPQRTDDELCLMPLAWDLDDSKDLDHALADGRKLVRYLVDSYHLPEPACRAWFSGNRGLHITVHPDAAGIEPSADLAAVIKLWALDIADRLDLRSCDRSIYGARRMWRLPDSIHGKTGLYKTELHHAELFTLDADAVRALAANPRGTLWA